MQLVLYYSGHGVVDTAGNYCAVPTDFTQPNDKNGGETGDSAARHHSHLVNLRVRFVRKLTRSSNLPGKPAKGSAIIVLLDMCRSPLLDTAHQDPVPATKPFESLVCLCSGR
jgi:hypothetical protein